MSSERRDKPPGLNPPDRLQHLFRRHYWFSDRLDLGHKRSSTHDVFRHLRFEGATPYENHDGMKHLEGEVECGFQRLHMLVILANRILESIGLFVYFLRPLRLPLASEYPTLHVLGLDHEYSEFGHEYMIYLRCSIQRGKRDIVKGVILILWQEQLCR